MIPQAFDQLNGVREESLVFNALQKPIMIDLASQKLQGGSGLIMERFQSGGYKIVPEEVDQPEAVQPMFEPIEEEKELSNSIQARDLQENFESINGFVMQRRVLNIPPMSPHRQSSRSNHEFNYFGNYQRVKFNEEVLVEINVQGQVPCFLVAKLKRQQSNKSRRNKNSRHSKRDNRSSDDVRRSKSMCSLSQNSKDLLSNMERDELYFPEMPISEEGEDLVSSKTPKLKNRRKIYDSIDRKKAVYLLPAKMRLADHQNPGGCRSNRLKFNVSIKPGQFFDPLESEMDLSNMSCDLRVADPIIEESKESSLNFSQIDLRRSCQTPKSVSSGSLPSFHQKHHYRRQPRKQQESHFAEQHKKFLEERNDFYNKLGDDEEEVKSDKLPSSSEGDASDSKEERKSARPKRAGRAERVEEEVKFEPMRSESSGRDRDGEHEQEEEDGKGSGENSQRVEPPNVHVSAPSS